MERMLQDQYDYGLDRGRGVLGGRRTHNNIDTKKRRRDEYGSTMKAQNSQLLTSQLQDRAHYQLGGFPSWPSHLSNPSLLYHIPSKSHLQVEYLSWQPNFAGSPEKNIYMIKNIFLMN